MLKRFIEYITNLIHQYVAACRSALAGTVEIQEVVEILEEGPASTYELTREFHEAFGHPVRETPGTPDAKTAALRIALIHEELTELTDATFPGLHLEGVIEALGSGSGDVLVAEYDPDLVEIADAYADLDVVVNGGGLVHGLPMPELAVEVFDSNMSKLDPETGKPILRGDGKILKSSAFCEPDIEAVLLGRM